VELFNNNHLVVILPGGLYESAFSDDNYKLMWGNRKGFAKVALKAKVVIFKIKTKKILPKHF
jgi:hypothetical protein